MLGTGRPFLVEIQNARQVPSVELINQIQMKINNLENKFVSSVERWYYYFIFSIEVLLWCTMLVFCSGRGQESQGFRQ